VDGDIKEVIGTLMHVIGGGEVSRAEVEDLSFEAAADDLRAALNEGYLKLLEFAYDHDARVSDPKLDGETRSALQQCLSEIVRLADPSLTPDDPGSPPE
jgi:hypothetical protein